MDEALYTCRFFQFAAAMLIFGTAAFRRYALVGNDTRAASDMLARFDARFKPVLLIASSIALSSAIARLLCQTAEMAGSPAAAGDYQAVSAVLLETRFGRVWCFHLLLAAMLVFIYLHRQPRRSVVLLLSLGLLISLAWVGHATMEEGAARIGHELNQSGHLLAAGLWLGGLAPLGWVLCQARHRPGWISSVCAVVRNFSQMGYAAVALLTLTGAINTLLLVGSPRGMLDTPYGRLLAFKILLFLAMVVVASINRFHFAPRISDEPGALRALGYTVAIEQILGLAVLAVVSVLGTLPPALRGDNL